MGAEAEIEPDLPVKNQRRDRNARKGVRLSSREKKAVKAEKMKVK